MNNKGMSTVALAVFLLAFSCVLLMGAPRLIANCGVEETAALPEPVGAYLCSASAAAYPLSEGADRHTREEPLWRTRHLVCVDAPEAPMCRVCRCDANGNVLHAVSYMRSVYYVFDLGDGFA